jgi:hypothetical protein
MEYNPAAKRTNKISPQANPSVDRTLLYFLQKNLTKFCQEMRLKMKKNRLEKKSFELRKEQQEERS